MQNHIRNTNLRFNLDKDQQRRAWEYLQTMDRQNFKSYSQVISLALVDYFDRYYRTQADPYLETREKEDAFADRIVKQVEEKVLANLPQMMGMYFMQQSMAAGGSPIAFSTVTAEPPEPEKREEEVLESA